MIKAIFFDLDGTINDAKWLAHFSLTKTLDYFGFKYDDKKTYEALGNKMPGILKVLGIKTDVNKFREKFLEYFISGAKEGAIKRCGNLRPLWRLSKEFPMTVISNSPAEFIYASIDRLNLHGMFNKFYGGEAFDTKDKFLKKLFRKMKIKPSEAIYVGDRFSDVRYAKKAGCISVAIYNKYSWSNLEKIKKENPDYIIKNFSELRKLIKKINSC